MPDIKRLTATEREALMRLSLALDTIQNDAAERPDGGCPYRVIL